MIGNDIVDLRFAKVQSNWMRPRFVEKICTDTEFTFIHQSINPELEIWKLWSRKEAAYKIYNRETGIRGYFPWKISCSLQENSNERDNDFVTIYSEKYYTKTIVNAEYIYTIAAKSLLLFNQIIDLSANQKIIKINDLPFVKDTLQPVSITNHGRFEKKITLVNS
jgi:phosphopantetheinyl transferase (holo-ACP synthase)